MKIGIKMSLLVKIIRYFDRELFQDPAKLIRLAGSTKSGD